MEHLHFYKLLKNKGVELKQKPFAIGVRIEQSQEMINASQYGEENKVRVFLAHQSKVSTNFVFKSRI